MKRTISAVYTATLLSLLAVPGVHASEPAPLPNLGERIGAWNPR